MDSGRKKIFMTSSAFEKQRIANDDANILNLGFLLVYCVIYNLAVISNNRKTLPNLLFIPHVL